MFIISLDNCCISGTSLWQGCGREQDRYCHAPGLFCCVFAPRVLWPSFSLMSDWLIWSQVCLLSSLITLSLKAPVLSVSVCWSLNVFLVFYVPHLDLLKTFVLWIPRLRAPWYCVPGQKDQPTTITSAFSLRFVYRFFSVFCFRCVSPWIPSSGPNSFSSCWSRGTDLSRTILDCSCV